ncbi:MAG TPA: MFS transporter [Jiangellaceae bacterium]|nr:MFS transporter [Jiangellaceae bacterium]
MLDTVRRTAAPARLAGRLYVYSFFDEFILLYPFYAILFADTGLSTAQISSLFVIWSVTSVALEIPSGVLADVLSRRLLLVIGPLLTAAGYALWTFAPSYPAFAAGFVLWGAKGALESGALEALVYDELDRHGAASRYATVRGRSRATATTAIALAMAVAGPVFGAGGYQAVGVASIVACLLAATMAATFPEPRDAGTAEHEGYRAFAVTLRSGFGEVRRRRPVLFAVLFLAAVSAIWGALDEYVGLLAAETGVSTEDLPALVLVVYVGVAVGGLVGGLAQRLRRRAVAGLLALAAGALAVGALVGHPAGFALIGAAFCVFQLVEIAADARLQHAISGPARSTVTSVAGFGTEVATIGVFVGYGVASTGAAHGMLFAGWAVLYAVLAVVLAGPRPAILRQSTA